MICETVACLLFAYVGEYCGERADIREKQVWCSVNVADRKWTWPATNGVCYLHDSIAKPEMNP